MNLSRTVQPNFAPVLFAPVVGLIAILGFLCLASGSFLLQPGLAVDVPRSPFLLAPQNNPTVVGITAAPAPAVYFENRRISIDRLRSGLVSRKGASRIVTIKADRHAPAELIVGVTTVAIEEGFDVVLATAHADDPK